MRLSTFTDYCLRTLMYVGAERERLVTIGEIAQAHGISENHLMKVAHHLSRSGFIDTQRGKGGGMRLARDPGKIVLGDVIRQTETDFALVECMGDASSCRLGGDCELQGILQEALTALLKVMDGYTLADLIKRGPRGEWQTIRLFPPAAPATGDT